jgi:hypothetical protein
VEHAKIKRPRGRPKSGRIAIQVHILPEIYLEIERRAALLGIPKGQYIELMLKKTAEDV